MVNLRRNSISVVVKVVQDVVVDERRQRNLLRLVRVQDAFQHAFVQRRVAS
jgi:hypothetical protein